MNCWSPSSIPSISMLKPFLQTLVSTHEREKGEELRLHALQVEGRKGTIDHRAFLHPQEGRNLCRPKSVYRQGPRALD